MSARRKSRCKAHQAKISPAGWWIFIITLILSLIGLFFVFEASTAESFASFGHQYHFLQRQAMWLGLGLVSLLGTICLPIKFWQKSAPFLFIFSLVILCLVFIPGIGLELNGARRWLMIGGLSIQPIEFVKLAIIIFFASWMSQHQRFAPFVFLSFLPSLFLFLQPDMGSLLIVLAIVLGLYFISGGNLKLILPAIAVVGLVLLVAILFSPYRLKRLKTYFNPESDPLGASFHIRQITLALGSGGWFGQGLGNSKQKYAYIPEASSDSIFAIMAEELGFVGSSVVLGLISCYFYLIYRVANQQPTNSFAQLTAYGILFWLSSQTLLNLAAVVALVPLTGLPLPFLSYGGSALVMALLASGILIRLNKEVS